MKHYYTLSKIIVAMLFIGLFISPVSAFTNLAYGKTPTIVGFDFQPQTPEGLENIVDNNFNTEALAQLLTPSGDDINYIQIDLGAVYNLNRLNIKFYDEDVVQTSFSNLKVSSDGTNWITVHNYELNCCGEEFNDTYSNINNVRYIRSTTFVNEDILFLNMYWYEIQAFIPYILESSTPDKIFKCGESTISITSDIPNITNVDAILTSVKPVQPMVPGSGRTTPESQTTVVPMTWNGTYWVGTFGNDANLLWGKRNIVYNITNEIGTYTYSSSSTIFVYSDSCTGTGKNSYQNYTHGIGKYTNILAQNDTNIVVWSLYPWIQYWGYLFYVIVLFIISAVIYMKTQNSMHVLFTMLAFLLTIAALGAIPLEFRSWIIAIIALILGSVFYRLYVRD